MVRKNLLPQIQESFLPKNLLLRVLTLDCFLSVMWLETLKRLIEDCPAFCCSFRQKYVDSSMAEGANDGDGAQEARADAAKP